MLDQAESGEPIRLIHQPDMRAETDARLTVFSDMVPRTPPPLIYFDPTTTPRWLLSHHANPPRYPPFALSCYYIRDLVVSGRGHIFWKGELLAESAFMPRYWRKEVLGPDATAIPRERELPVRVIEEPCVVTVGHGHHIYGHILLDTLPRIAMVLGLGLVDDDAVFLFPNTVKEWIWPLLSTTFGIDSSRVRLYDPRRERVQLDHAVLPTLPSRDGCFHPAAKLLFDRMIAITRPPALRERPKRLFITRAHYRNPDRLTMRTLTNAEALQQLAENEFGFSVVAPEALPWAEQIALFSSAEIIVGEYGSALHNTLFSPAGARVMSLGLHALDQTHIAALCRHRAAYLSVIPEEQKYHFRADPELFRRMLGAVVDARIAGGASLE